MPLAQRQSEVAAAPAGGLEWISVLEAADRLNWSDVHVRRMCRDRWVRGGRAELRHPEDGGKPQWYIRVDAHRSLVIGSPTAEGTHATLQQEFPQKHYERGCKAFEFLDRWMRLCSGRDALPDQFRLVKQRPTAAHLAKVVIAEANHKYPGFHISVSTLKDWQRKFKDGGLRALIPKYSGGGPGGGDGTGTSDGTNAKRSPEAIEFFYALYRTEKKMAVTQCHEYTLSEAKLRGWSWAAHVNSTRQWLDANDDLSLTYLMREGKKAWSRKYMPALRLNWNAVGVGDWAVTDHTECDFFVSYRGDQIRPWLTAIMDCRSRCIIGWHLGPSPHQDAILAAMRMAFHDWCIPLRMRIDNGKDFASKLLTGVTKKERDQLRRIHGREWAKVLRRAETMQTCDDPRWLGIMPELGMEIIYAIPYSPHSKGLIERWFGTFEGQCGKTFSTYCGNNPTAKPESLKEIREGASVPTMEEARETIGMYMERYHHQVHRSLHATPKSVFDSAPSLRKASRDALASLLETRGAYTVKGDGVTCTVGAQEVSYGRTCAALDGLRGREVLISIDPHDISHAYARDMKDRRIIARLESNVYIAPGTTTDDSREAVAESRRAQSAGDRVQHGAARRGETATQIMARKARERRKELAATGTEGKADQVPPTYVPVITRFEGGSKPDRVHVDGTPRTVPDRKDRSLVRTADAIFNRNLTPPPAEERKRRVSMDQLATRSLSAVREDEGGTEAEKPKRDILSLVAGKRHVRANESE